MVFITAGGRAQRILYTNQPQEDQNDVVGGVLFDPVDLNMRENV